MQCGRCGHENISSFRFCEVCLAPLKSDDASARSEKPEDVVGRFFADADMIEQGSAENSRGQVAPARFDLPWRTQGDNAQDTLFTRQEELGQVAGPLLDGLRSRRCTAVTLQGEHGSGRSTLLAAVRDRVATEVPLARALVVSGQGCVRAYSLIERLVRLRFDIGEYLAGTIAGERFERSVEAFYGDPAGAEVARTCGPMLGFHFWNDHDIDFLDRGEQARRAREALFNLLYRVFQDPPTLLVIDDAGEADAESLQVAAQVLQDAPDMPLAMLFVTDRRGAVRRPWLADRPILELQPVPLPRLIEVAQRALRGVKGTNDSTFKPLAEAANGRPGMLLAALETLAKQGAIRQINGQWTLDPKQWAEAISQGDLYAERGGKLDGLTDFQVQVASYAAVFGTRCWGSGVVALLRLANSGQVTPGPRTVSDLGRDTLPEQVFAALQVLTDHGVLLGETQSQVSGEVAVRFLDESERLSLLELHDPAALQRLSLQAAVWLQMVAGDRGAELAEVLAPLWLLAGDRVHAAHVYLRAGKSALDEYRNDAALHCLEKARELAPADLAHVHVEAAFGLGRLHEFDGKYADAERLYRDALELAWRFRARSLGAKSLQHLGRLFRTQGKVVQAIDHLAPALRLYEASQDMRGLASACDDIGRAYWTAGRLDAAQQFLKRAAQYRERLGDRAGQAHTLTNLGIVLLTRGRIEQAKTYLERATSLQRERKNLLGLVEALNALGAVCVANGEQDAAVAAMEEGLAMAKRVGNRRMLALLQNNLGEVLCLSGRIDEGEALLYKAVESAGRLGDNALLSDSARNLALAAHKRNDDERALKWARRAVAAAGSSDVVRARAFSHKTLAEILADTGDPAGADEAFGRAEEWFGKAGEIRELGSCLQGHAAFLVRIGKQAEAKTLLDRADELQAQL